MTATTIDMTELRRLADRAEGAATLLREALDEACAEATAARAEAEWRDHVKGDGDVAAAEARAAVTAAQVNT